MCLIVIHRANDRLSAQETTNAFDHNGDGIGVAAVFPDRVEVCKMIPVNSAQANAFYTNVSQEMQDAGASWLVWHWRFTTHGTVSLDNTHPFQVPDSQAVIAHNGVMPQYGDAVRSDTREWVEDVLAGMTDCGPVQDTDLCGSRIAVCWPGKPVQIFGDWKEHRDDVWVSNEYSLRPTWHSWRGDDDSWADYFASKYGRVEADWSVEVEESLEMFRAGIDDAEILDMCEKVHGEDCARAVAAEFWRVYGRRAYSELKASVAADAESAPRRKAG